MNKMSSAIFIIGGLALVGLTYYSYQRRKNVKSVSTDDYLRNFSLDSVDVETVDSLSLNDIVSYFKGLKLRKGHDIPFISNLHKVEFRDYQPSLNHAFMVATYNEDTNDVENYKLIETNSVELELLNIIGDEKLVVLS